MSLSKQFLVNKESENKGVKVEYGFNEDGSEISFTLARMSKANKRYQKAFERATKPHMRSIQLGVLDEALAEKIQLDVFAKTVLVGWDNVCMSDVTGCDDEGFAPCTPENIKLLMKRLPELYDDLSEKAQSAAIFREEELEEAAKN